MALILLCDHPKKIVSFRRTTDNKVATCCMFTESTCPKKRNVGIMDYECIIEVAGVGK